MCNSLILLIFGSNNLDSCTLFYQPDTRIPPVWLAQNSCISGMKSTANLLALFTTQTQLWGQTDRHANTQWRWVLMQDYCWWRMTFHVGWSLTLKNCCFHCGMFDEDDDWLEESTWRTDQHYQAVSVCQVVYWHPILCGLFTSQYHPPVQLCAAPHQLLTVGLRNISNNWQLGDGGGRASYSPLDGCGGAWKR